MTQRPEKQAGKGNQRASPRMPCAKDLSIEGQIEVAGEGYWAVRVVDLSLQGVLLAMPEYRAASLQRGQAVSVKLSRGNEVIWVDGMVQRFQPARVGIVFPNSPSPESKRSANILAGMVRALDRYHLRRKTSGDAPSRT